MYLARDPFYLHFASLTRQLADLTLDLEDLQLQLPQSLGLIKAKQAQQRQLALHFLASFQWVPEEHKDAFRCGLRSWEVSYLRIERQRRTALQRTWWRRLLKKIRGQ